MFSILFVIWRCESLTERNQKQQTIGSAFSPGFNLRLTHWYGQLEALRNNYHLIYHRNKRFLLKMAFLVAKLACCYINSRKARTAVVREIWRGFERNLTTLFVKAFLQGKSYLYKRQSSLKGNCKAKTKSFFSSWRTITYQLDNVPFLHDRASNLKQQNKENMTIFTWYFFHLPFALNHLCLALATVIRPLNKKFASSYVSVKKD